MSRQNIAVIRGRTTYTFHKTSTYLDHSHADADPQNYSTVVEEPVLHIGYATLEGEREKRERERER